ncbi:MAG TPA: DUF1583 domain-containing protein, partial [Pirellulales bacterium]|nr:DUF1583 domain-containing protein [Pirellulales bacterium]
ELPPVGEQALAGKYGDFLEARRAELTAKFDHDFARDGLPGERFSIAPRDAHEVFTVQPDGLHAAFDGRAGYRNASVAPRLIVGGDFDVTASFERFQPTPSTNGLGSVLLLARTAAQESSECILFCRAAGREDGGFNQSFQTTITRPHKDAARNEFSPAEAFEASSARLRLARRGEMVYFLIAENDSPSFRLIRAEQVSADDLALEGLRFMTQTKESGRVEAVWKKIEVCAERLSGPAVEDAAQIMAELDRQRDLLAGSFVHDFTVGELTLERFHRWNFEPPAKPGPDGLRLVAQGADQWSSAGVAPHVSLRGDFDISVEFEPAEFDPPKAGQNSTFFLQVVLPSEPNLFCAVVHLTDEGGRRRVLTDIRRQKADGSSTWLPSHEEVAESIVKFRLARRGEQLYLLCSSAESRRDRLLGRFDCTAADVADSAVQLMAHAGGAGRTAEFNVKRLEILAKELVFRPAGKPASGN